MSLSRKFGIALGVAVILATPAPHTYAASQAAAATRNRAETVTWTLPAGQCPSLPPGLTLSGSGERHQVINESTGHDGTRRVIINDVVNGTAWDNEGGTYGFKYTNHSIDLSSTSGGLHQISMVDSFVLNGTGSAKHMNVGFSWSWTYQDPAGPFDVFPLANLVQKSTRGNPLLCDPL
jgi:hypothetical protein